MICVAAARLLLLLRLLHLLLLRHRLLLRQRHLRHGAGQLIQQRCQEQLLARSFLKVRRRLALC